MMWDGKKSLSQRILKEVCYRTHCIVGIQTFGCLLMYHLEQGYLACFQNFVKIDRKNVNKLVTVLYWFNIQESALGLKTYPDFRELCTSVE